MDINKLLHALDNENNEAIIDLDYAKIAQDKNDMLQQLNLPRSELAILHKQLKSYRLINNVDDLRFGSYVRWISLKNPEVIKLTNGGIVCDMKIIQDDLHIKCKNRMNRLFQIKLSEVILFQKLSEQEQVILKALKHLQG
jgi:hypothetical protein